MILAIDIGNTNIVLGCMEGKEILKEARMATDTLKTSDQYCAELKGMLDLLEVDRLAIEGCIISSVVPPVLNSFRTAIIKLTGKNPLVVGPGIKTGINILLDNPAMAGGDLIVAAVAALAEDQPPSSIWARPPPSRPLIKKAASWVAAYVPASRFRPKRSAAERRSSRRSAWRRPSGPSAEIRWIVCSRA